MRITECSLHLCWPCIFASESWAVKPSALPQITHPSLSLSEKICHVLAFHPLRLPFLHAYVCVFLSLCWLSNTCKTLAWSRGSERSHFSWGVPFCVTFFSTETLIKSEEFGAEPEKIWQSHINMRSFISWPSHETVPPLDLRFVTYKKSQEVKRFGRNREKVQ